jgi:hypothetical protein
LPHPALFVWLIGPALVLTVFGAVLFRQNRTLATALVALGFAAAFVSGIANVAVSYQVAQMQASISQRAHSGLSVYVFHSGLWTMSRLCGPIGMWVASLSLLWHMFETRGAASTHNRWRGP